MRSIGDLDKYPKLLAYSMYPIFIQSGMVLGVGIATYTPLISATCLYWRDVYEGYLEDNIENPTTIGYSAK